MRAARSTCVIINCSAASRCTVTKVQFLHADEGCPQHLLEPPQEVDGLRIAQLSDLMAMKLKVLGDRVSRPDYLHVVLECRA
jgi:hypothetical protein